jgi:autotransporter-associated beta strand protein
MTVIKTGSGPLNLSGHNTYSGGTYILEGTIYLAGSDSRQADGTTAGSANPDGFGTGPVYILPGGRWFMTGLGAGVNFTNDLFISGVGTDAEQVGAIRMGGGNLTGTITLIGDATLGGGGNSSGVPTSVITGRITGDHKLTLGGTTVAHEKIKIAAVSLRVMVHLDRSEVDRLSALCGIWPAGGQPILAHGRNWPFSLDIQLRELP